MLVSVMSELDLIGSDKVPPVLQTDPDRSL